MKMNNDNFVWTDELVKEFIDFGRRMMVISDIDSIGMNIDKFKQSKSIPTKEYEILTMINSKLGVHDYDWQCEKSTDGCKIHSVKRLSDGEVFTIGDKIKWDWVLASVSFFTIKEFMVEDGLLKFKIDIGDWYNLIDITKTHNLKKVEDKKPILTTEDGVDIFENDRVWFVDRLFNIDQYDFIDMGDKTEDLKYYPELYKYFSTEEKAKEYIRDNKPTFSVNQIYKICNDPNFSMHDFKNISSILNNL